MTDSGRFTALFRAVVESLEAAGLRFAVIGALARSAWGRPRATTDADFAIALDAPGVERLLAIAAALDLAVARLRSDEDGDPVPDLILLRGARDPSLRIDFLVAKTPFEAQALARRRHTRRPAPWDAEG